MALRVWPVRQRPADRRAGALSLPPAGKACGPLWRSFRHLLAGEFLSLVQVPGRDALDDQASVVGRPQEVAGGGPASPPGAVRGRGGSPPAAPPGGEEGAAPP